MAYRTEHPKPQFEREGWLCLNGPWEFEIDHGNSGEARGLYKENTPFSRTIEVPFCPESSLSGVGYTDFMSSVWYRRRIEVSAAQLKGRVLLHFGAVDHKATIYVNETPCGSHTGGYVSFSVDITDALKEGTNTLVVHAEDDTRSTVIPSGKQSPQYASYACFYTRTTGIWQTVWLEYVPLTRILKTKYYPDAQTGTLTVMAELCGAGELRVEASFEGRPMGQAAVYCEGGQAMLTLPLAEHHLWNVGKGDLYDLVLTYGEDRVKSYFGLRSIRFDGRKFRLNGKSVFQRLVLDQGFYPDGIYTAPSDRELEADVERSMAMGFNGARLHEKVFEERFLYHCDRKGYLVWGEFPSWGLDECAIRSVEGFLPQWLEELDRDFNHPAIIGWCPFNETWSDRNAHEHDALIALAYHTTKAVDPTRPCIDTSGYTHVVTDIFDVHDYEQEPAAFAAAYATLPEDGTLLDRHINRRTNSRGLPVFVSEYGGIRWTDDQTGWGYGEGPKTAEEFLARLKGLTDAQLDNPCLFGYCYTQLTDVEQEQNGLYTYDRRPKFDPAVIAAILGRKAAIEE
ncbi:MAG: beta-galactosidase [Clostridia bacterium]|nr:beta-galactosidase [Clostridia bacterium]